MGKNDFHTYKKKFRVWTTGRYMSNNRTLRPASGLKRNPWFKLVEYFRTKSFTTLPVSTSLFAAGLYSTSISFNFPYEFLPLLSTCHSFLCVSWNHETHYALGHTLHFKGTPRTLIWNGKILVAFCTRVLQTFEAERAVFLKKPFMRNDASRTAFNTEQAQRTCLNM